MRAQRSASASCHSGSTCWVSRSAIPGATHVPACTPLVIEVIGISSVGTSGHRSLNISRLTSPCSLATALDRPARRRPITAMLNRSSGVVAGPVAELHELVEA